MLSNTGAPSHAWLLNPRNVVNQSKMNTGGQSFCIKKEKERERKGGEQRKERRKGERDTERKGKEGKEEASWERLDQAVKARTQVGAPGPGRGRQGAGTSVPSSWARQPPQVCVCMSICVWREVAACNSVCVCTCVCACL